MPIGTTNRGFEDYADFQDSYGASIIVRESSAAMGPHVWVFANGGGIVQSGGTNEGSAHLNVEQAKILRDALTEFIERVPQRWECVCDKREEYGYSCPVHPNG
jgi:hypothetical protein